MLIKLLRFTVVPALVIGFTLDASSDTFTQVQLNPSNCSVVQAGTMNKVVFFRRDVSSSGDCQTVVPVKEFNKHFQSCSIGVFGVFRFDTPVECAFGYYDNEHTKVFFTSHVNKRGRCEFICTGK